MSETHPSLREAPSEAKRTEAPPGKDYFVGLQSPRNDEGGKP